jgi:hypothetical protein
MPAWAASQAASVLGTTSRGRTGIAISPALWPEYCKAMVSVSGYLIGSQASGKLPLPPKADFEWWYQYYFATERGREGYDKNRHDFAKVIWQQASPKWDFNEATFERSAKAFETVTTSPLWSIIIGGEWALPTARRSMTSSK